jgi:hypothetical protein
MNRIETLARKFEDHISLAWQSSLTAAEKTIFVVYPKEEELRLRAKKDLFRQASLKSSHPWREIDLDAAFPKWMAALDYAEEYHRFPEDLRQKLETEFTAFVASLILAELETLSDKETLALFGVGTLFGLTHLSSVLKKLDGRIRGRLVVFFPGSHEKNVYRLLDARDGWNYMASPITLNEVAYL